jgi:hypothetical protein
MPEYALLYGIETEKRVIKAALAALARLYDICCSRNNKID